MFVLLTNASKDFEGLAVAINTDIILTVFEMVHPETKTKSTIVHSASDNWEVKETVAEVVKKINPTAKTEVVKKTSPSTKK